jgi:hypothetical protein
MHSIETLSTSELEALSRAAASNQLLSDAERSAILHGISAELSARGAEAKAIRAENSNAFRHDDLL